MIPALKKIDCTEMSDFVDTLFEIMSKGPTLFRGCTNQDFDLTPSIFRKNQRTRVEKLGKVFNLPEPSGRMEGMGFLGWIEAAQNIQSEFFRIGNARNLLDLNLPESVFKRLDERSTEMIFFDDSRYTKGIETSRFPDEDALSVLALAQHEGLPTPLLDWSEMPMKATFFAIDGDTKDFGEKIAVYCLSKGFFEGIASFQYFSSDREKFFPRLYFPQYRGNSNLYAQSGAMSYLSAPGLVAVGEQLDCAFDLIDGITKFLESSSDDFSSVVKSFMFLHESVITKITLPKEKVPELRARLIQYGITASTIYPGFEGVRREMERNWRYGCKLQE